MAHNYIRDVNTASVFVVKSVRKKKKTLNVKVGREDLQREVCREIGKFVACRGENGRQTLPSFVPFIMLTLLSGTENGDSSNTCCTCGSGEGKENVKKQQRNGLNGIYCNGTSSTGLTNPRDSFLWPPGRPIRI